MDYCSHHVFPNYGHIVAEPMPAKRADPAANYRLAALVAVTERERAYRYDFMRQFRERLVPNMFWNPASRAAFHFHTISFA